MNSRNCLYLLLLLFLACCCNHSSALRCYTCEDCDEQSQLKEMEVCRAPNTLQQQPVPAGVPSSSPSSSPSSVASATPAANPAATAVNSPAPAPAAAAATPAAATPAAAPSSIVGNSEDEDDYDSDEDESVGGNVIGTGAAAVAAPAAAVAAVGTATPTKPAVAAAAPAPAAAAAVDSDIDEDEDEDYDDRRRRRMSRQAVVTPRAVCYIASLHLNGTEITNRGCTFVMVDDQVNACNSLFDGWDVVGCQLCEANGCNAPIHATVTGQFSSGSCRISFMSSLALVVTLLALTFS